MLYFNISSLDLKEVCFMSFSPNKLSLFQRLYCYFLLFSFLFSNSNSLASNKISYQNEVTLKRTYINNNQKDKTFDPSHNVQSPMSPRPDRNTKREKDLYGTSTNNLRNSENRFDKAQKSLRIQTYKTPIQSTSQQMRNTNKAKTTSNLNKTNREVDYPVNDEPKSVMVDTYEKEVDKIIAKFKIHKDPAESYNKFEEVEKSINRKIMEIRDLPSSKAQKRELNQLFEIKMKIWEGKLESLNEQKQFITENTSCSDIDYSWSFSNLKNNVKCRWEQRKQENLAKKFLNIVTSSQQELQDNRAYIDSIPLHNYTNFLIYNSNLDGNYKEAQWIIHNLYEGDCSDLPGQLNDLSKEVRSNLKEVTNNNFYRNWTRSREAMMGLVNQRAQDCINSNQILKQQKHKIAHNRSLLDKLLKNANDFESQSDREIELYINFTTEQSNKEGTSHNEKVIYLNSIELAKIELGRRNKMRENIEESRPKNNFMFLNKLGDYLKLKFR